MELNREQIVKALECCASSNGISACESGCPLWEKDHCPCIDEPNAVLNYALVLIRELAESLDRVQKQCGEIIVECDERDAERLKQVAKLTEENKRLKAEVSVNKKLLTRCSDLVEHIQADTLKDVQIRFAMHFGTYTDDAEVKVSEVFKLLSKFKEEMLEGEI